ncbi:ATP-binding cassette sub-family F member 3-like isoform X3 [Halichondria panicea]|uniref:ATP-binding cassette sub-family F member 3-like isoform X3 n=1 Tax=Halichondria panicea TaxID=6063 RepID=UPI00312B33C3
MVSVEWTYYQPSGEQGGGRSVLLSNANLTLARGRRYGLVGRNGVGKSTLLRSMACRELRLPAGVSVLHVEQEVTGDNTLALDSVLECDTERVQLLAREGELLASGDKDTAAGSASDELAEVYLRLQEIDADKAPARAGCILAGLGFTPEMQGMQTREFSGGWRMRLALARTLFARPDVLLLDEPTNMLDIKAIMWLQDFLQTWPSTLLTVSHDRVFLTDVCTDIIHLHSRALTYYKGNYEVFMSTKTERLKNQQREYESQMQYRQHLQEFIDRWRYNAKRSSQAQMRIKILEKLPILTPVVGDGEVVLRFPDVDKLSPPILQLTEVVFGYSSDRVLFKQLNINADMESRIAMVGENGAGKSTLVKLLTGELSPQDGYRSAHRNLKIAYFSQHHVDQLVMESTPLHFIQAKFPGMKDEEYRSYLGSFGVTGELALRPIASLSGGQKSRLAFALMAMPRPNFLIMDEPTNHLDMETVDALAKALERFKGGVVLVSHDQHLIEACATEVWLCKEGTVKRLNGGLKEYRDEIQAEMS